MANLLLRGLYFSRNFYRAFVPDFVSGAVRHFNWADMNSKADWLSRFINKVLDDEGIVPNRKIDLYSVFGTYLALRKPSLNPRVFFSGENLDTDVFAFRKHAIAPRYVDLYLGFDCPEGVEAIRFPLWITYLVSPEASYGEISEAVDRINGVRPDKTADCALISRHDTNGLRGEIYGALKDVVEVECAGKFLHNSDRLWSEFGNDKIAYLESFKFNICPENSDSRGYVTEKLFEAFRCGTVPIYWGSGNEPEPGIVNPEAVLFWDRYGDNGDTIERIRFLCSNQGAYEEFVSRLRLFPYAKEYMYQRVTLLKDAILRLVDKK